MREFPSSTEILKVFKNEPEKTFRLRELVVALELRSSQARDLKQALRELARRRQIVYLKKNHFAMVQGAVSRGRTAVGEARPRVPQRAVPAPATQAVSGRLIGHRDGYGFVVPDQPVAGTTEDIFIPPDALGSAMHGDRVEVHLAPAGAGLRSRRPGAGQDSAELRLAGRILRVTERAQKTVVGEFHCGTRANYVLPFDHRIPFEITIPPGQEWPRDEQEADRHRQFGGESEGRMTPARTPKGRAARDLEGLIVDVELTRFPDPVRRENPGGRVIEVLGRRDDFGVDVEMIIRKYHLPHRFPADVLAEATATPQYIPAAARTGRRDFRDLPIVTIDGETAKDFDDAVHVGRLPGGNYLLQVHVADVAHYVRPGSALDREARLRGTSVYFPDRAVPMLPLDLSNGICSLNPRVERLVMSVLLEIDAAGRLLAYELTPGVIQSAERMTYTDVYAVLAGDSEAGRRYRGQVEHFQLMEELARLLNRRREARGSIDFDLPEPEIEFDALGRMVGVARSERNIAHRIIEEFMLAANEMVAEYLEQRGFPALYRIHEKPEAKKVLEFEQIAASFGYSLGIELPAARRVRVHRRDEQERYPRFTETIDAANFEITSRHYQRLTQRLAGQPEERILSYLMLRSLPRARYSEENAGHFALASPTYSHFTSPIRRYPDLVVHRLLKAALTRAGGSTHVRRNGTGAPRRSGRQESASPARATSRSRILAPAEAGPSAPQLHAIALEASESERRAADAERELMDWKKVAFMAGRLGDEFDALIISVTRHGFFVELIDLFVEGFVSLASLNDDRYIYRERLRAVVGARSQRAYRLGERVRVRLDRIDRSGNKLEFSLAEKMAGDHR